MPKALIRSTLILVYLFCTVVSFAQDTGSKTPVDSNAFKNPPNEYRITQYGSDKKKLRQFPEYGIGGMMAFLYRYLPQPPEKNLADSDQIRSLVDSAKSLQYKIWLADDYGYPSGMAGGKVVAEHPDFEVKGLTMITLTGEGRRSIDFQLPADLYDIRYATIYPVSDGRMSLKNARPVDHRNRKITTKGLKGDWQLKVFARYVRDKDVQAQETIKQFGHTGRYPDLMNEKAVASFIQHMHQPILAQIDDYKEKVEGFYTNEPNLMQTHWNWVDKPEAPYACIPWSEGLIPLFEEMHGYDLISVLPSLFEGNQVEAKRARLHFRQTTTELLLKSFARQIREWCNARGLLSSGHFLLNEYLIHHVQGYGDLMKFVSEFDVPALDIPIPNPEEFSSFPYQQTRFFSSVASWKKSDKTLMLLDPIIGGYGFTRMSPDLPLLLNAVNMGSYHGANVFTSYLPLEPINEKGNDDITRKAAGYSKEEYNFLNEYVGRLTQVLRGARRDAGVALYYPISNFQAALLPSKKRWPGISKQYEKKQADWDQTESSLLTNDIEYMIVHPDGVENAKIEEGRMLIGHGAFHTLVMPKMEFIPLAVTKKILELERAGGKVLWVDQVPTMAENQRNDDGINESLGRFQPISAGELKSEIDRSYSSAFDLSFSVAPEQMTVGRYTKGDHQIYLLVNRKQEVLSTEVSCTTCHKQDPFQVLDPSSGLIREVSLPTMIELKGNRSLLLMGKTKEDHSR